LVKTSPNFLASLGVLLLLALASPISSLSPAESTIPSHGGFKLPAAQSLTLPWGYFVPLEIEAVSNATWIAWDVQSNLSISTALMDSNQFNEFNNSLSDDVSNSITYENGVSSQGDQQVSFGIYYLVFYNYQNSGTANISFTYLTYPFTPYAAGPVVPPEPTGLASFGLYNASGNAIPYSINTTSIVGTANISSIQAYNASAASFNDTVSGATLQLNAVLVAMGLNGTQQDYWIQNTPDFVTNASQVAFGDNAWNNTDEDGFLSNQTMTSPNGNSVYSTGANESQPQYFYGYSTSNYTYVEPFDLKLLLNDSVLSGKGVLVQIGTQVLQNGSVTTPAPVFWFDNITISDPAVQTAYFHIDGNSSTPIGSFYDTELVFGGEGNLEATNFTSMNATLGLYYLNASSDQLSPFPSYFSFGGDTGEAAYDLHVNYLGNGTAEIAEGTPNYIYLIAASNASETTTSSSSYSTTASSSSSSTTSSGATTSSAQILTSSSTVRSSSSANTALNWLSNNLWLVLVLALVLILFAVAVTSTRRDKSDRLPPSMNSGY
jgi:thermopsin